MSNCHRSLKSRGSSQQSQHEREYKPGSYETTVDEDGGKNKMDVLVRALKQRQEGDGSQQKEDSSKSDDDDNQDYDTAEEADDEARAAQGQVHEEDQARDIPNKKEEQEGHVATVEEERRDDGAKEAHKDDGTREGADGKEVVKTEKTVSQDDRLKEEEGDADKARTNEVSKTQNDGESRVRQAEQSYQERVEAHLRGEGVLAQEEESVQGASQRQPKLREMKRAAKDYSNVSVHFHVLASPTPKFDLETRDRLYVSFGQPVSDFDALEVELSPVRTPYTERVGLQYYTGEYFLPKELRGRYIPYTYLVWENGKKKLQWESVGFKDDTRCLVVAEGRESYHQYDDVVFLEPNGHHERVGMRQKASLAMMSPIDPTFISREGIIPALSKVNEILSSHKSDSMLLLGKDGIPSGHLNDNNYKRETVAKHFHTSLTQRFVEQRRMGVQASLFTN